MYFTRQKFTFSFLSCTNQTAFDYLIRLVSHFFIMTCFLESRVTGCLQDIVNFIATSQHLVG